MYYVLDFIFNIFRNNNFYINKINFIFKLKRLCNKENNINLNLVCFHNRKRINNLLIILILKYL